VDAIKNRDTSAGNGELMSLLSTLTRVLGLERATLGDLGLDRKARRADDVMALLVEGEPEDAQLAPAQ
jgi:hypothetical protein